jgi:hypothetical protein
MKPKSKPVPRFKSIEEEADYWDTHSIADHLDYSKPVKNVRFRRKIHRRIRLPK